MAAAHWELTWFEAEGDDQAGGVVLDPDFTLIDIQRMFFLQEADQADGCLIVRASQRKELQDMIGNAHEIDLNKYDYFVEAVADV